MDIQQQAEYVMADAINIVLRWNEKSLSDKEAMIGITLCLLRHKKDIEIHPPTKN